MPIHLLPLVISGKFQEKDLGNISDYTSYDYGDFLDRSLYECCLLQVRFWCLTYSLPQSSSLFYHTKSHNTSIFHIINDIRFIMVDFMCFD